LPTAFVPRRSSAWDLKWDCGLKLGPKEKDECITCVSATKRP